VIGFIVFRVSAKLEQNFFSLSNAYEPNVIAIRALTTIILTSLIMTLIEARRKTRSMLEQMNSKLHQELEWIESRSSEVRDEIANVLHGPLQGRIAGIALALRLEDEKDEFDDSLNEAHLGQMVAILESVLRDVQQLFEARSDKEIKSIAIKLQDLKKSWQGIAEINWKIDAEVFAHLPDSKLQAVKEIFYEAVSNAVRHGRARNINFDLAIQENSLISIITDDGAGLSENSSPGIGLHKIINHGGSYSFNAKNKNGAQLIAKLPLN
jgi:signal transduction histidine kinase